MDKLVRSEWAGLAREDPVGASWHRGRRLNASIYLLILMATAMSWLSCGDSTPAGPGSSGGGTTGPDQTEVVTLADTALTAVVRQALGGPDVALTRDTLLALKQLNANGRGITALTGIEALANLEVLELADNRITDLSPLTSLIHLRALNLDNNQVRDLSPLAGLSGLELLVLDHNQIEDLTPLLSLEHLQSVGLVSNPVLETASTVVALRGRGVQVDLTATVPSDSSAVTPVTPVTPATGSVWLTFLSSQGGGKLVYAVAPDGTGLMSLTGQPEDLTWAAISPDGTRLALVFSRFGPSGICLARGGSNDLQVLPPTQGNDNLPVWSPDGNRIAYVTATEDSAGICVYDLQRNQVTPLTWNRGSISDLGWSPDGGRIVFSADLSGSYDLYLVAVEGGEPVRLTDDPKNEMDPAWSPDGSRIAFASNRGGRYDLYTVAVEGNEWVRLTSYMGNEREPAWSPDGSKIAFVYETVLMLMPADGGLAIPITSAGNTVQLPVWVSNQPVPFYLPEVKPQSRFTDPDLEQCVRDKLGKGGAESLTEEDLKSITELDIRNYPVATLEGIEQLSSLTRLRLDNVWGYGGWDEDGHPIPDTTNTERWSTITDLGPLHTLTGLSELQIYRLSVTDLTPLGSLKKLRKLDLASLPVSDLSGLDGCVSLTSLEIDWCHIHDLTALSGLLGLKILNLGDIREVADLTPLAGLHQLASLSVVGSAVKDLSPLIGHTRLSIVDFTENQIEDISPLLQTGVIQVTLTSNPLNENSLNVVVPALRARGAGVYL